jgi:hypothetical protein
LGKESGLESDVNVLFVETKTYEKKRYLALGEHFARGECEKGRLIACLMLFILFLIKFTIFFH